MSTSPLFLFFPKQVTKKNTARNMWYDILVVFVMSSVAVLSVVACVACLGLLLQPVVVVALQVVTRLVLRLLRLLRLMPVAVFQITASLAWQFVQLLVGGTPLRHGEDLAPNGAACPLRGSTWL